MKSALSLFVALQCLVSHAYAETAQQPVFLLCPHKERYSAWSLFVTVDKADPSRILGLGLEKLKNQNAKDSSYEAVLAKQLDPGTERETIGTLDAKDFEAGVLAVKRDDALRVSVKPVAEGLQLMVSMRISAEHRFTIGGQEQKKRDVLLRYDPNKKTWSAWATALEDHAGKKIVQGGSKAISGIVFPVTGTGIYRVLGVVEGEPVLLLDR